MPSSPMRDEPPALSTGAPSPSQAVLPPTQAQLRAVVLLFPIALLTLGPHLALWGLPDPAFPTQWTPALVFGAFFVAGTALHEVLHGWGHTWGPAAWDDVRFGMHWSALTPYARCDVPARAQTYRWAVGLPGLVLGILPATLGLAAGYWLATFFGFLMLVAAAGDILVLWILRSVPARAWVQDHPREVGCLIVADASATSPSPVSEADLPAQTDSTGRVSLLHISALFLLSLMCAVLGFLIALA